MNYLRSKVSLVLLFLLVSCCCASAATHEEMVARYIEKSGVGEMLRTIPESMDALASQSSLTSRNPDVDIKVNRLLKESFDLKQAEKSLATYLLRNTDRKFIGDMLQWLETPLATKISKEEIKAAGPDKQPEMLRYLADLTSNPPSQERIAVIQEVEQATHLSELTTNILMELSKGMLDYVNRALPQDKRHQATDDAEMIENMRPVIQESLRKQMILSSFYVYRNISNEELRDYAAFYRSELGQKEIAVTGAAVGHVLRQWLENFGDKMIDDVARGQERI